MPKLLFSALLVLVVAGYFEAIRRSWIANSMVGHTLHNPEVRREWQRDGYVVTRGMLSGAAVLCLILCALAVTVAFD